MLRAISEMAVVISVNSLAEKRSGWARPRARCRASMTSVSERTGTTTSSGGIKRSLEVLLLQLLQSFLEIERGSRAFQGQSQLHHGEGDVGLNADDDRFGAEQPHHLGYAAQGARGEAIH